MKKYLILLVIGVAVACAFTFASGIYKGDKVIVKIEKGEIARTIEVRLANLEKMFTKVAIQDYNGTVWFDKPVNKENGYATRLNLADMPDGDYVLFVENKSGMWAQAFNMRESDVAFFEVTSANEASKNFATLTSTTEGEKGKLITHITNNGDLKLGVQLANLRQRPSKLRIINLGVGITFMKEIEAENGYHGQLDLKGTSDGNYFLYIKAYDATVVQFFTVEEGKQLVIGEQQRLDRNVIPENQTVPPDDILSVR